MQHAETGNGDYSLIYRCYNSTVVIYEEFETKDCSGEVIFGQFVYMASEYVFDCGNQDICEYSRIRQYIDSSCDNDGSYQDIPIVVDECSRNIITGKSKEYKCTETALEEYVYATNDCSGDFETREIIYQNGDCGDSGNYYEVSVCGDFYIDGNQNGGMMDCLYGIFGVVILNAIVLIIGV